jgi:ribosome recycling factor
VSVFEPAMVGAVSKGIEEAEMDFVPEVQGKMIKVTVPRMTTEARELLVKQAPTLRPALSWHPPLGSPGMRWGG